MSVSREDPGPSMLARLSPWPEVAFYGPVLAVVVRAGIRASLGRYDDGDWIRSSERIIAAMRAVGIRLTVEGLDGVRGVEGPVVFAANHMSTLETFVLPALIQPIKPVTFVVKDALMRYPLFGAILRSRDPIVLGRASPRQDLRVMLDEGRARLEGGRSVVVFPQTTRSPVFDPSRFNSIGAKLAARAGVALIPVALRTDAWGIGRRVKDFGPVNPHLPVHIRFGPALRPRARGAATQREAVEFIARTVASWGVPVVRG